MKKLTNTFIQKAGRAIIVLLMTSILIPALFAQSVWTGTGSTQWEDANSWSGGVPGPGMTATINACGKCPIINNAVPSIKSLTINGGASVKMNGNGSLVIEDLPDGLVKVEAGGFLDIKNNAVLQTNGLDNLGIVENAGTIVAKQIDNYLKFINKGNMTLDNPSSYAFINIPNDPNVQLDNYGQITITNSFIVVYGVLNNYGKLFIDNGTSNHSTAVEQIGTFNNFATGKVTLTNCQYIGFLNSGKLFNSGRFEIDGSDNYGLIHYQPTSVVENYATGVISVKNTLKNGIYNSSNFTNAGKITVESSGYSPLYNGGTGYSNFVNSGELTIKGSISSIENRGVFNSSGKITINSCNNGIANFKQMTNSGTLSIDAGTLAFVNIGIISLNYEPDVSFDNSGTIKFFNVQKGIEVYSGTVMNNSGTIEMTGNGVVGTGIQNFGNFNNEPNAKFLVYTASNYSILNTGGTFINKPCALVDVDQYIINTSSIQNMGFLKTTSTNLNQDYGGSFVNSSIIEDFNNSFNGYPLINNGFRIRPISGQVGSVIHNAIEAGGLPPFTIGNTWYRHPNLTSPAGTFSSILNTFTPTVGVGTYTLYFSVKDLVNNCTKTVSVKVTITSALIGFGEKDKPDIVLFNYPNPFVNETRIKFCLPFDATGKLVVYDQFGRLVEVIYEGEMTEGELYEFGFDASRLGLANYLATLLLDDGRSYPVRMLKSDN